ncbi:MAG: hydrogenase maturation protease [Candidatus Nitrosocaldus sp.]|nr:hydrogenase maturation protease [Candidatus Nitrosocaldus sp.]MDW8000819.1 hydrogenase maturation protease [Candidatus Nitrosocaldus sp.]
MGESKGSGRVLVVGVGNEYRRDDGIGPIIARCMKGMMIEGVDVMEVDDASKLLDVMQMGYSRIIVIDAMHSHGNAPIGTIHRFNKEELLDTRVQRLLSSSLSPPSSTHAMDVVEALGLAAALGYTQGMDVVLLGIEGRDFGVGRGLSKELEERIDVIVGEVVKALMVMVKDRVSSNA